ncbi:hypothetical protein C0J56_21740 [Pseudomonas fluorescens]|nr:hypothetical protein C0J56_21740 [Pseudomonas fluorescens]
MLAINDDTVSQLHRVASIASKLCSHRPAPSLTEVSPSFLVSVRSPATHEAQRHPGGARRPQP